MNDLTPNMLAYLDLVNDINHLFIGLEDEEPCDICDGDTVSYTHLTLPTILRV